jgi:hypothetical protein
MRDQVLHTYKKSHKTTKEGKNFYVLPVNIDSSPQKMNKA